MLLGLVQCCTSSDGWDYPVAACSLGEEEGGQGRTYELSICKGVGEMWGLPADQLGGSIAESVKIEIIVCNF